MLNYFSSSSADLSERLKRLSDWLSVLSEPRRLQIFNLLMEGVQCNCDIGDKLQMAPNLISHHMNKLRAAGLVNVERSNRDARWLYFSVNREALDELNTALSTFFDPERIQPRDLSCGPKISADVSQRTSTRMNSSKTDLIMDKEST